MRNFMKALAIGSCVVAGPLLATTAMSIGGYIGSEETPDDGFSLDRAFIDPGGGPTPQCAVGDDPCYVYGYYGCTHYYPVEWCLGGGGGGGGSSSSSGGGGGGGDGGQGGPNNPFGVAITGRDCAVEAQAAEEALTFLYNNSQTARALIDTMANQGTEILLVNEVPGDNEYIGFDSPHNYIRWDPFVALNGYNSDGSLWELSPVMILAHELVHASLRGQPLSTSETHAMEVANQIAREVNAATGRNFNTNRDVEVHTIQFYVNGIYKSSWISDITIARPGCS